VDELGPAFKKYNEEQFTTVIVSSHNNLGGDRYYDLESSVSFVFNHATQKASGVESYVAEGETAALA
jgi:capping protein alpha